MRLELMYAGATNRCVNQLHQYRHKDKNYISIHNCLKGLEKLSLPNSQWKGVDSNHRTRRSGFTVRRV